MPIGTAQTSVMISLLVVCLGGGCNSEGGAEEYAKRQAELADKDKRGKVIKVDTALPSGAHIACDALFDAERLTAELKESQPVTVSDQTGKSREATAICSIRRGGKRPGQKAQERIIERRQRLGVLAGDELCNVTLYCSVPADEGSLKENCRSGGMRDNNDLGVFACVKVTPKGAEDAFTYRFIDPDTRCTMRVRGGPGVIEEAQVQTCARAAMNLVVPAAIRQ